MVHDADPTTGSSAARANDVAHRRDRTARCCTARCCTARCCTPRVRSATARPARGGDPIATVAVASATPVAGAVGHSFIQRRMLLEPASSPQNQQNEGNCPLFGLARFVFPSVPMRPVRGHWPPASPWAPPSGSRPYRIEESESSCSRLAAHAPFSRCCSWFRCWVSARARLRPFRRSREAARPVPLAAPDRPVPSVEPSKRLAASPLGASSGAARPKGPGRPGRSGAPPRLPFRTDRRAPARTTRPGPP
jgi:hypothetical protein